MCVTVCVCVCVCVRLASLVRIKTQSEQTAFHACDPRYYMHSFIAFVYLIVCHVICMLVSYKCVLCVLLCVGSWEVIYSGS